MLRILSWNILQGGGSRTKQIIKFIESSNAQIIVLSEFRNNKNGIILRSKLMELNYHFQATTLNQSHDNSVLIASKLPCDTRLFTNTKLDFSHGIVAADFEAFSVIGVYLPHKKKHKLFDILNQEAKKEKPAIICGDFNTGKNFIDQKGDSFWYTAELKSLERQLMVDAFRHVQGSVEAFSWYSHQGNGYRYDHTYVNERLLPIVKDCDYIQKAREDKLSDHAPMYLDLGA